MNTIKMIPGTVAKAVTQPDTAIAVGIGGAVRCADMTMDALGTAVPKVLGTGALVVGAPLALPFIGGKVGMDAMRAVIKEYESYKKKNADVVAMLDSEPLLKLAVQAANIFGGVTGPALRWMTMRAYDVSSSAYHKGIVKIDYLAKKGIYSVETLRYWEIFVRKGNPAVELQIDGDRSVDLREVFVDRHHLTPKGEEIKAAIVKGDLGVFDEWFGGAWLNEGEKSTPKVGTDPSYEVWRRKVLDLFLDIVPPFANQMKLNIASNQLPLKPSPQTERAFTEQITPAQIQDRIDRGVHDVVSVEILPDQIIDFDFTEISGNLDNWKSKIGAPEAVPPVFREHTQVVFEEWFRGVLRMTNMDVPTTSASPGAAEFAEAYRQAYAYFLQIVDPDSRLRELEGNAAGSQNQRAVEEIRILFDRLRDQDGPRGSIEIPVTLNTNAAVAAGMPPNKVRINWGEVQGHEGEILEKLGLKDGKYAFKRGSADVFAEWFSDFWGGEENVPLPGMLNYAEYMTAFAECYKVWKQILLDFGADAATVFDQESTLYRDPQLRSDMKRHDLAALRMVNASIKPLLQEMINITKPDAPRKTDLEQLGITDSTVANQSWKDGPHSSGNFAKKWAIVWPAIQGKRTKVAQVRAELEKHFPTGAGETYKKAAKTVDDAEKIYQEAAAKVLKLGLEEYFESLGPPHAEPLKQNLGVLLDKGKPMPERIAAWQGIVDNGQIPDTYVDPVTRENRPLRRVFATALAVEDVAEQWQSSESTRINGQVDYVRNTFIERSPEAAIIEARIAAAERMQGGIDSLGSISENLDVNNLSSVTRFCYEANHEIQEGVNGFGALGRPMNPRVDEFKAEVDKLLANVTVIDGWTDASLAKARVTALQDQYKLLLATTDPNYVDNQLASAELKDNRDAIQLKIQNEIPARVQRPMVRLVGVPVVTPNEWALRSELRSAQVCDSAIGSVVLGKVDPGLVSAVEAFIQTNLNEPRLQAIGRSMRDVEPALIAALYIGSLGGAVLQIEDKGRILAAALSVLES